MEEWPCPNPRVDDSVSALEACFINDKLFSMSLELLIMRHVREKRLVCRSLVNSKRNGRLAALGPNKSRFPNSLFQADWQDTVGMNTSKIVFTAF